MTAFYSPTPATPATPPSGSVDLGLLMKEKQKMKKMTKTQTQKKGVLPPSDRVDDALLLLLPPFVDDDLVPANMEEEEDFEMITMDPESAVVATLLGGGGDCEGEDDALVSSFLLKRFPCHEHLLATPEMTSIEEEEQHPYILGDGLLEEMIEATTMPSSAVPFTHLPLFPEGLFRCGDNDAASDWISRTLDLDALGPDAFPQTVPSTATPSPMTSRLPSPAFDHDGEIEDEDEDEYSEEFLGSKKRLPATRKRKGTPEVPVPSAKAVKKAKLEAEVQASQLLPALPKKRRKVGVVMTEEERRERNRVSALKYRLKQRFDADGTEGRAEKLERENQLLMYSIMKEKQTIAELRDILAKHGII